jgi:hypothetical protein
MIQGGTRVRHGTRSGYNLLKCRCEGCCKANTEYLRAYMGGYTQRRERLKPLGPGPLEPEMIRD